HGGAQAGRRRGRLYRRCFRLGKRLFELDAVAERARHRVTRYRHRAKCVRETKSGHGHNGGIADTSPAGGRRLFASTAGPCPCSSMSLWAGTLRHAKRRRYGVVSRSNAELIAERTSAVMSSLRL